MSKGGDLSILETWLDLDRFGTTSFHSFSFSAGEGLDEVTYAAFSSVWRSSDCLEFCPFQSGSSL